MNIIQKYTLIASIGIASLLKPSVTNAIEVINTGKTKTTSIKKTKLTDRRFVGDKSYQRFAEEKVPTTFSYFETLDQDGYRGEKFIIAEHQNMDGLAGCYDNNSEYGASMNRKIKYTLLNNSNFGGGPYTSKGDIIFESADTINFITDAELLKILTDENKTKSTPEFEADLNLLKQFVVVQIKANGDNYYIAMTRNVQKKPLGMKYRMTKRVRSNSINDLLMELKARKHYLNSQTKPQQLMIKSFDHKVRSF